MIEKGDKPVRLHIKASTKSEHPMNINLMTCPKCGTVYHWGTRGWGNCPTCNKDASDHTQRVARTNVEGANPSPSDPSIPTMIIKRGEDGIPLPFAMGICKECGEYISPGFMIWESDPCPLCKKPFYPSLPRKVKGEEK